jgi:TP901 family phage tail tape measure protein
MAGDTNSNIFINIDTSQAMTQLRLLEKELTALNRSLIVGTKAAAAAQAKYAQSLLHNVNATGQWTASMTRMSTASEQFATNLDRQRLSLKEYFRYGAASTKTFGKMFGREFDTIEKLVDKRVKTLQQQYVQLGRDAQGAMNSMKFTPKSLNMQNLTTQLMMATQRQQIMNKLIDDGSTKLLNFGKNTQWAGRQLMVGFTIPLMLFGAQAIKVFKEIETQTIRFKKVYGDIFTDQGATDAALKNIRALGDEYTKYGLKVSDTIKMAADAAAAGFSGKGLEQLVEQTNKLAVLGGVTQEKALETTIALKNAFQIDTGDMAGTIDFLNAVENQTVVALEDLTEAIPKVAPVIQQLGGDVKDLAYFMAAMQEGGISAAQGANALKSGLASLINPSNAASKAAAAVGINIKGIVEANAGNLRNTVTGFAQALQPLTDLERSRVIEKVFGKYQFARISALLNNLGREGTQAARVLQLTNASVEELAILSQRELKTQADSPMNKLAASIEKLKVSIAPIGELFAKVFTPVIEFIGRMADKFNNLPEGIKKAIGIITVVVGGLGPIFLMTFGLLANAVANSVKGIQVLRKGYQQLAAGSTDAALKTQYLSQEELENISISNALYSKHQQLSAAYALEANALASLTSVYTKANASMGAFAASNPGMFMPRGGLLLPKKFAGGTTSVPGPKGAGDVIPAMLSPGESVIPVKQTQKYAGFINQIIQDKVPGFFAGRVGALPSSPNIVRGSSARGPVGPMAPVIPIGARPISSSLPGIRYAQEGDKVRIFAGDTSFLIPLKDISTFKVKLQENEAWMKSPIHGSGNKNVRKDNTEQALIKAITRPLSGGKKPSLREQSEIIKPGDIYTRLPKAGAQRKSNQNQDIADKRFKALVKSKNPHLAKLQNYLQNEEKVYLERVLGPDVVQSLKGFDAKKLTPSHIREVRSQNRTPEDWAPSKIARDWAWFNSALRGTKFGKVKGGHPVNAAQARELLDNLKMTPFENLPNDKKALQTVLEYRLNRQPSYYDDFRFIDNAMMKVNPVKLAGGVVSLGMPIPFKKVQAQRAMAEKIDAQIKESRFKNLPVTDTGTKIQKLGGFSVGSISRAVNGVYQLPNGRTVVYKAVESEEAALAEMRMSTLMRKGSELDTPSNQSIKVIADPTDLSKQRKVLVIESDYNPRFANPTGEFTPKQFIKQTLASGIRGDKDLKTDNVSGNDVVDMSNAGVFPTASNRVKYADEMKSVEEQLLINFGAVKGGASKDFSRSVQGIAAEMGFTKFKNAMLKEIEESIPRYKATIDTFKLNPRERELYDAVVARLEDAKKADWKKIYNAAVGDIPGYANGIVSVPGPKGAGDIQPAMLSPGEAVIPAKQSEKYMPLIRSMIADNVPGFAESNVGWDGYPASLKPGGKYSGPTPTPGMDSWGDPIKEPTPTKTRLRNAITSVVRDKDVRAVRNFAAEATKAGKETKIAGKAMEAVKKAGSRVAASLTDTDRAATGTTDALGKDKTRGFRGFLSGYGNVSSTVTNEDGTTRAATAAERTNARQMNRMNFTQKMMPMQMAGMMVPMIAQGYAQKNPDSSIAKSMDAIMMLSMLTMILPMLNSPLKMLAAIAVGLTIIFKMQAATIKKNMIEGQKQAEAMSMTTKNLEELGKITNRVSITQTAAAKRAGRNTDISPVSIDFGRNLIDSSDFGKKLKSTFESSLENLGEGAAVNSLVGQLGTAVSQGVLSVDQAESIAVALTRDLKDARLEVSVRGRLIQLLGPNGENVLENPLKLQLDLLSAGEKVILSAVDKLNKVAKQQVGINTKAEVFQLGAGAVGGGLLGARAGFQAANMMQDFSVARGATAGGNIQSAMKAAKAARLAGTAASAGVGATGVGAIPGLVGIAISTVIFGGIEAAIRNWQKGKEKALIAKSAGVVQGLISQNLAASQASIDALTSTYDAGIANLELKKKTLKTDQDRAKIELEIAGLEIKKQDGLKTLRQEQAKMLADVSSSYNQVSDASFFENISPFGSGRGQVRDKFMEAFSVGMQDKFKDNAPLKAQAAALQSQLDKLGKDEVTVQISTLVTSDVLTPNEASTLLNTLTKAGGNISKNLEAFVDVQGTEGLQRLSTILTMISSEENQKALLLEVEFMNKAEADAVFNSIEELGKIPPFVGIDLNIETDADDIDALEARGKEIDILKSKFPNGQVTLEALIKMQEEAGGVGKNLTLDSALKYWDQISKLDKNVQLQAIITVSQIEFSDSFDKILDRELDAAFEKANPKYAGTQAFASDESRRQFQRQEKIDREMFKADAKNRAAAEKAAMNSLIPKIFPTAPVSGAVVPGAGKDGAGKAKRDESFLDDLAQRLKLVKEGAFNALKPMESLRKFLNRNTGQTENNYLEKQDGAIKQIEAAAKNAEALKKIEKATGNTYGGEILIDKDFMEIIRSLDAEQFALWTEKLFEVDKAGNITALKEDFVVINEGFRKATIGGFIQDVKDSSKEIENQVNAYNILSNARDKDNKLIYNTIEIQKILQNVTLTAKIAAQGGLQATKEEQAELNKEIQKTINLNYQLGMTKLSDNISETKMQVEAFKRLTAAGVKHEVILEILKDKNNAFAIASADATVKTKDKFGDLINKTKEYSDLLELIANQTKTFEQKTQEGIDANVTALDLQARTLQNQFDLKNFELKAEIKLAENAVEKVNNDIQKEQDKIDKINFELKYDSKIGQNLLDDIQENINDAQRKMEIDFDRPLQALSDRSNVLSNDLTLIDKAAEAINEKYDKQEEALRTISELNQDIAAQEQKRISLADALSQGDISAAAQLANEMRSTAADAANRRSGEFLAAARKAETEALVSASGMTKAQIEAEQFRISQQSYALEQQRKTVQAQILGLEDQVYNITELREVKLLAIRDVETVIDGLKAGQLAKAQEDLNKLQERLDKEQEILDAAISKIDLQKLKWDEVQLKLDAYKGALIVANGELRTMKDLLDSIAKAMSQIKSPDYKPTSAFIPPPTTTATPAEVKAATDKANAAADASDEANKKAEAELAAQIAAQAKADAEAAATSAALKKAIEDTKKAIADAAKKGDPASKAYMDKQKAAQEAEAARLAALAKQNAQYAARAAGYASRGQQAAYASGGMVKPKYFAVGGKARGTDIIPAMLTPGEFVMSKYAVDSYGVDKMKAINSGSYEGEKVYNYNLNVNVKSDANPEDIARVVMTQIRQVDSQRIRTQRG